MSKDMTDDMTDILFEVLASNLLVEVMSKGLVLAKHNLNDIGGVITKSVSEEYPGIGTSQAVEETQKNIEKALLKRIKGTVSADEFKAIIEQAEKYYNIILEGGDSESSDDRATRG